MSHDRGTKTTHFQRDRKKITWTREYCSSFGCKLSSTGLLTWKKRSSCHSSESGVHQLFGDTDGQIRRTVILVYDGQIRWCGTKVGYGPWYRSILPWSRTKQVKKACRDSTAHHHACGRCCWFPSHCNLRISNWGCGNFDHTRKESRVFSCKSGGEEEPKEAKAKGDPGTGGSW
jgi:hypothetical protein